MPPRRRNDPDDIPENHLHQRHLQVHQSDPSATMRMKASMTLIDQLGEQVDPASGSDLHPTRSSTSTAA